MNQREWPLTVYSLTHTGHCHAVLIYTLHACLLNPTYCLSSRQSLMRVTCDCWC